MYLGIDTATPFLSLALWLPGEGTLASCQLELGRDHGARIMHELDELFTRARCNPQELTSIAVGLGPGSYTGLRVGVATAKGLAHSLGCSLVGKSSLDAMAAHYLDIYPQPKKQFAIALDARRGNIYVCRFIFKINIGVSTLQPQSNIDKFNRDMFMRNYSDWPLIENIAPSAAYLASYAYQASQNASHNPSLKKLEPYYL